MPRTDGAKADGADLQIYREWLEGALTSYPDEGIRSSTELVIDGYDVVDAKEYPPAERLDASAADGYDVVMLTGSSQSAYERV